MEQAGIEGDVRRQPVRPSLRARSVRFGRTARRLARRTDMLGLAVLAGIVGSGFVVQQSTNAAFTASTANGGNSWASGSVSLTDDDSATALFNAGPLVPGNSASRCIVVTYGGSLTSPIRLYATGLTGTLGPDLLLTVAQSTGGSFADCTGFNAGAATTVYSGTVAGLAGSSADYATGVPCWTATAPGQSRVFKFTWTLDPAVANSQQGASAGVGFTWEAQS